MLTRLLILLFAANLLNFFDRVMPAIVVEEIRLEFRLTDADIGLLAAALSLVYATAGVPLGWLADRRSRTRIVGAGLAAWSLFTAATGAAWSFAALLAMRVGVGIGEATCAPAANSLIGDLYPTDRRSRATSVFGLGLPLGLLLAYLTVGPIADALDSWRAPFVLAGIPGLVVAVLILRSREPVRGAAEPAPVALPPPSRPVRRILAVPTFGWLLAAFTTYSVGGQSIGIFTVPLLQRSFGLALGEASVMTGVLVGATGILGLVVFGPLADRASRRSPGGRALLAAACLASAMPLVAGALALDVASVGVFGLVFGVGWLLTYGLSPCLFPALSDVIEPRLRATAVGLLLAVGSVLGGGAGPVLVGVLSDLLATNAMIDAGASVLTDEHRGIGLRNALEVVMPVSLGLAALAMLMAARTLRRDRDRMVAGLAAP